VCRPRVCVLFWFAASGRRSRDSPVAAGPDEISRGSKVTRRSLHRLSVWFQDDHRGDRSLPGRLSEGGRHGDRDQRYTHTHTHTHTHTFVLVLSCQTHQERRIILSVCVLSKCPPPRSVPSFLPCDLCLFFQL